MSANDHKFEALTSSGKFPDNKMRLRDICAHLTDQRDVTLHDGDVITTGDDISDVMNNGSDVTVEQLFERWTTVRNQIQPRSVSVAGIFYFF